ncbi:MAG TPA: AMP-binding protein [Steroidobacteraceae bacterium]|jgi:malonyl-CoA/methylmalonyl-CoA synthetase
MSQTDLIAHLEFWAERRPQHRFLHTSDGREITYRALADQVARFAAALAQLGVMPGDRVAVQVEKSAEAVLLYLGCLWAGAVFVPINTANTAHEVEYFLKDAQPKLAVVRPASKGSLGDVAREAGTRRLETLGEEGEGSLIDLVRRNAPQAGRHLAKPADLGAIVYTSGTTGRSKGAMISRANLASNATVLSHAWRFTADDVLLHVLPLFHIHGLFVAINTLLVSGAGMLLSNKFQPATAVRQFAECSVFMGVPTHYVRLLQQPALTAEACAHMRLFISGSAPLLSETHQQFLARTGQAILERYGMSETLINTSNPYDGIRLPGSVGPPLPGISVRVAEVSRPQEVGALEVKGPNVCLGYWHDPAKTESEFTADGWFKTGDLGRIDEGGYVHIVGRAKDLVISGGYNVYPKEVESELDLLSNIVESAVFGVPHPDFGEGVTACVVVRPGSEVTEADIIGAVQTRLARYKVPKRVLLIDELPRNTMGKVQKNELRKRYNALYRGG